LASRDVRFTPESGQTADVFGMSALCQKRTFALQQDFLFDHLVGAGEQRRWGVEAEGFPGFEVVDFNWLINWTGHCGRNPTERACFRQSREMRLTVHSREVRLA
jgi:hypothetical protein